MQIQQQGDQSPARQQQLDEHIGADPCQQSAQRLQGPSRLLHWGVRLSSLGRSAFPEIYSGDDGRQVLGLLHHNQDCTAPIVGCRSWSGNARESRSLARSSRNASWAVAHYVADAKSHAMPVAWAIRRRCTGRAANRCDVTWPLGTHRLDCARIRSPFHRQGGSSPSRRSRKRRSCSCRVSSSARWYEARASAVRPRRRHRSACAAWARW